MTQLTFQEYHDTIGVGKAGPRAANSGPGSRKRHASILDSTCHVCYHSYYKQWIKEMAIMRGKLQKALQAGDHLYDHPKDRTPYS